MNRVLSETDWRLTRDLLRGRPSRPAPLCDWSSNGVLTLTSANGGGESARGTTGAARRGH